MMTLFRTDGEKTDVLVDLRTLMRRFYEGDKGVANGIRISNLEKAIACVEATKVKGNE